MTTSPFNLPPRRSGHPADAELLQKRAGQAQPIPGHAEVASVTRARLEVGGVEHLTFTPPDAKGVILHFHGGGYRQGSPNFSAPFASRVAAATGATVVGVRYALAPEAPFPAGLHDAAAVYAHYAQSGDEPIFLAGDSAGGGLAMALALACRGSAVRPPAGLILISPWVDLTVSGASYQTRAQTDQLFSLKSATDAAALYLQGHDPADPLVSPGLADLAGLPPVAIFVGAPEVLLDENIQLAARLAQADVDVEFHSKPGVQHTWPVLFPDLPQSKAALQAIGDFVRRNRAG
jgi:monoterpene epsilon-lactone hydrolase